MPSPPHRHAYEIEVANRQRLMAVAEPAAAEIIRITLQAELVAHAAIELAIVDDATIHRINREHLEHDFPTDVISFLYSCSAPPTAQTSGRGAGRTLEGEIVVSAETALRQSAGFGWRAEDELALYIVHGTLHLCGYDDQSRQELRVMRARERAVLKIFGLTPHYEEKEDRKMSDEG